MSDSMDDLLRKSEEVARRKAEYQQAKERDNARQAAIAAKASTAFQFLWDRITRTADEFNNRSKSGKIGSGVSRGETKWEFMMPNTENALTLEGLVDSPPKKIKGKLCQIMATLTEHRGHGIHFLLLEDEADPDKTEWVAVRAKAHALTAQRRTEPFVTSLNEIAAGAASMHTVVPDFSGDIDGAIREMIGYGVSA
jgi:hypothetical protein